MLLILSFRLRLLQIKSPPLLLLSCCCRRRFEDELYVIEDWCIVMLFAWWRRWRFVSPCKSNWRCDSAMTSDRWRKLRWVLLLWGNFPFLRFGYNLLLSICVEVRWFFSSVFFSSFCCRICDDYSEMENKERSSLTRGWRLMVMEIENSEIGEDEWWKEASKLIEEGRFCYIEWVERKVS